MSVNAYKAINNTLILYGKMFFSMLIGFFTIRIVLHSLGDIDYGIYILVAGVVATLSFLNSVLSNSTLRFFSHSLGKVNLDEINSTFGTSVYLHIAMGLGIVILIETGGWFMFRNLLNIPPDRFDAALLTFHLMAATTFITIVSVPYDALISSHEDFFALSIIDVITLILKLIIALALINYKSDRLIFYSVLIFAVTLGMRISKQIYSRVKYRKIMLNKRFDRIILKSMLSFSGWMLFSSLASIGYGQVTNIIINMFFGLQLNAANGIAYQVRNHINVFSINLTRAMMPQLIKSEGGGNRKKMLDLTGVATKFAIYFFSFFSIPILFELPVLLNLWLVDVPDYTVVFCRLLLIGLLLDKFTFHLGDAMRAVGEIKWYQVTESLSILLSLPISFLLFKNGYPPQTIYIVPLIVGIFVVGLRFYFSRKVTGLNIRDYVTKIVFKAAYPIIGALIVLFVINYNFTESVFRVLISFTSSSISFVLIAVLIGLETKEKNIILKYIKQVSKSR